MRFGKPILVAAIGVLLAAYAFDCAGMATPEQAMQCCNSMPCSPQEHHEGQDCCKTMRSTQFPFVQPPTRHVRFSLDMIAVLPTPQDSVDLEMSARSITADWHAPPPLFLPSPLQLRI